MRGEAEARIMYKRECMKRAEQGLPPLNYEKRSDCVHCLCDQCSAYKKGCCPYRK